MTAPSLLPWQLVGAGEPPKPLLVRWARAGGVRAEK